MNTKIRSEILPKIAQLNFIIDILKSNLPSEQELHANPKLAREYYILGVLRDIEAILQCLVQIIGIQQNPSFSELKKPELIQYTHIAHFNLWQRKIHEHFVKTILFSLKNDETDYRLFIHYNGLNQLRNIIKESELIFGVAPKYLVDRLEEAKAILISDDLELKLNAKPWFVKKSVTANLNKNENVLHSFEHLFSEAIRLGGKSHIFLLSLIGEYGRLSNYLHATLIINTHLLSDGSEEVDWIYEHFNNYVALIIGELLALLFQINSTALPDELKEVILSKEDMEENYDSMFCKKFTPGELVTFNVAYGKIFKVIQENTESIKGKNGIMYDIEIDNEIVQVHSLFLKKA